MASVVELVRAFELLYDSIWERDFRKSLDLHVKSERELAPLVRTFLLGYFGALEPECWSALPGALTGWGRIDFVIGGTAVELAVRRPGGPKGHLLPSCNETEVKKLLKHDGKALLVLYDFAVDEISAKQLGRYRKLPSLGKGPHNKSAFNVAYVHRVARHRMRVVP